MKHLVILGSVWPEPNSSAAGTRMCQLMDLFQSHGWRLTFACAALPSEHGIDLAERAVAQATIELNSDSFDQWLALQRPDAVLFDRFMTEEQFGWRVSRTCPEAVRLLDTEDLHCLRAARWEILKTVQAKSPQQWPGPVLADRHDLYSQMVTMDVTQRELASIYRSDLSLMVSDFEVALLQEQFGVPSRLLHALPIWADSGNDAGPDFEQRQHFISIGNFRHAPNWDAVLWFKQQLWPIIRERLPQAELHLYGAYPPPKATALTNPREGFLVKGWVDNAAEVMASHRVCLAPLRFGAGIKGKLLDAMAMGTPSVTTTIGAESMQDVEQWPGRVADTAEDFCSAAVQLYRDASAWEHAQLRAVVTLSERFSRSVFETGFAETVNRLSTCLTDQRRANFVGTMLRHHQHRSTQYMSQWIEAKNRLKQNPS